MLLSGCTPADTGDDQTGPVSQDQIDEALSTPTELTFWTWVPDIENEVALFEETYPEIDVKVENVGQGLPHYQKLRSAIEAGEGGPGCRADRVPVHPVVRAHRRVPARPDALRRGRYLRVTTCDWAWNQVVPR